MDAGVGSGGGAPEETYDVVVVGGGPSGAIPPQAIEEFQLPDSLLVAKVTSARMISPASKVVDMPIDGGFVGMVDRATFDEWLRERAAAAGAERRDGTFERFTRDADGVARVHYRPKGAAASAPTMGVRTRALIGADGARSEVARQCVPGAEAVPFVYAYHEILRTPQGAARVPGYDPTRCDVYYQGRLSPDFYAWIFPHGDTISAGAGTALKGFSIRGAVGDLRVEAGLADTQVLRREGAPIPLKPLRRWDNGRDVLLAGDAAGVVAPASGEGIYYAMACGRFAGDAVDALLRSGDARALRGARRVFMKQHGRVFWVLGLLQRFWYWSDQRRERFVKMCADPDVQRLTWEAYMHKRLVRRDPMAHVRVFFKDLAHLFGIAST